MFEPYLVFTLRKSTLLKNLAGLSIDTLEDLEFPKEICMVVLREFQEKAQQMQAYILDLLSNFKEEGRHLIFTHWQIYPNKSFTWHL